MEKKQFHRRGLGMLLLLAVILFGLGSSLYDAQMIHGAEYLARSQNSIAETQTVEAARGDILDRYGRVLVSNRVTYQVALNTDAMEKNRNDILLALIRIARDAGVEWEDTLPITAQPPFRYTTDTPFQYPTTDEEGSPTTSLTRLGRLAVKMKWIDDPTADGAQGAPLPTAEELLEKMRESFQLELEGADMRAVAGVLYELYYRSMVNSWPPYVFAEGVDIDFISKVKEQGLSGVEIEAATVRTYNTEYAAHLLGRVGAIENWDAYKDLDLDGDGTPDYEMDDTVGKEGAELAFESYLRGTAGVREVERNTSGKVVSEKWTTAPQPGDNVVLTIDIDLQKQVEDILSQAIPQLASEDTEGAACVVMDVNRAEVLASASYPSYHLATYSADLAENSADPLKPFLNRAFQGVYAPGSTFKMVTAVAGLESGIIEPDTEIMDTGVYTYYQDDGPQCWYLPPVPAQARPGECVRGVGGLLQLLLLRCGPPGGHSTGSRSTPPNSASGRRPASSCMRRPASWPDRSTLSPWGRPGTRAAPCRWPSARRAASSPPSSWPTTSPPWSTGAPGTLPISSRRSNPATSPRCFTPTNRRCWTPSTSSRRIWMR